jgi:alpha-beta hydrolase superfamily lysophospholipase
MKKYFVIFVITCLTVYIFLAMRKNQKPSTPAFTGKTIHFKSTDGLTIYGDLYLIKDTSKPFILLFHQANYSRGEYRSIAQNLNKMGFNCLAIDQRAGGTVNDVENKTNKEAIALNLKTDYENAYLDLESALLYVNNTFKPFKTILWGSSYSASLVFILASNYPKNVSGIIAFSPGEYFTFHGNSILTYAHNIQCPTFITATKAESMTCQNIFNQVQSKHKLLFIPPTNGQHGSSALWKNNAGNKTYWKVLTDFFETIVN